MKTFKTGQIVSGYLITEVEIPSALAKVIPGSDDPRYAFGTFKVPTGWEVTIEDGDISNPSVIKHVQYYANCNDDCRHVLSGDSPVCRGCCWYELDFNLNSNYWRE